jgi:hypothetical protein
MPYMLHINYIFIFFETSKSTTVFYIKTDLFNSTKFVEHIIKDPKAEN